MTTNHIKHDIDTTARPEWLRLPKSGERCALTGLSRSALNELILPNYVNNFDPPVKSVSLRKPGQVRGVRLIHTASLLLYLESLARVESDPSQSPAADSSKIRMADSKCEVHLNKERSEHL
jgi:hypothetical protein